MSSRPSHPLEACGLHRRFGTTVALAGVDLVVRAGEVVGLIGPNGSGKTTLLELAVGRQKPDAGSISVSGAPAGSLAARRTTAFVPAAPDGLSELTVTELAALLRSLHRAGHRAERRFDELLIAFDLERRRHARLDSLSNGLRRQASLVVALALGTPLLVVDEATVALDPAAVSSTGSAFRARARLGLSTLLATQDLAFARASCDHLVVLEAGVIVDAAPPRLLRAWPPLRHTPTARADGVETITNVARDRRVTAR